MSLTIYVVSAALVFVFSGLLAMAGLGAAFLFVPLFYYLGVPLAEAAPTALLLNVVSLLFAAVNYWRAKLINWRVGLPVLVTAVILSPLGALLTPRVDKKVLLWMFAGFLVFAGVMMLFFKARKREKEMRRAVEAGAGSRRGRRGGIPGRTSGRGGRQLHRPRAQLAGARPQGGSGNNGARRRVLLPFGLPGPRQPRRS